MCFIFHKVAKGAVWKIKHSYEEYVITLLLFLFHSKFQRVKIAFLHNLKFKIYTRISKCSLKHSYSLATFSHIGKFARPIAIDYDYD